MPSCTGTAGCSPLRSIYNTARWTGTSPLGWPYWQDIVVRLLLRGTPDLEELPSALEGNPFCNRNRIAQHMLSSSEPPPHSVQLSLEPQLKTTLQWNINLLNTHWYLVFNQDYYCGQEIGCKLFILLGFSNDCHFKF